MNSYRVASQSLILIQPSVVNFAYRSFVRSEPCCACGRTWGIEFGHTGRRGLSQKASDLDGVPLCRVTCHQYGPRSYHVLGRERFERVHRLDLRKIIASLQKRAQEAGIDLSGDDTPKKRPGRAGGLKKRWGVA
jgi:hypothetical protein